MNRLEVGTRNHQTTHGYASRSPAPADLNLVHPRSVHPRAGGEHTAQAAQNADGTGSSPRGRGTRLARGAGRLPGRFIPARAGNTRPPPDCAAGMTVHPRAGREHPAIILWSAAVIGSSPRGRGTPLEHSAARRCRRFIPARAGNTAHRLIPRQRYPVHPRAGGEHCPVADHPQTVAGSSPRGRGTPIRDIPPEFPYRFIPARAGNTGSEFPSRTCSSVHPRAGGEHSQERKISKEKIGSSPRGRGTHNARYLMVTLPRFIPARAGNTATGPALNWIKAVHPRAGGEHPAHPIRIERFNGSSPRGRGTPGCRLRRAPRPGFIPARAGNTHCFRVAPILSPVHPRAGGEHKMSVKEALALYGSSPRGRGTRDPLLLPLQRDRFIPARAGNTVMV